ncbi:MAG TPA: zinc dependent phospholipase C family protein [Candidatus Acidoferrales bacterium]|nr:zinc dependent phospholipase C family protein [Candidatus Acidoferrales bacterium]
MRPNLFTKPKVLVLIIALVLCLSPTSDAYSVLTHEAVIDSEWDGVIKPLLLERYPNSTPADLKKAHAFAYGGAIIQDMGYYPFGNKFFSDLTHYVRSADFIRALIRDSQNVDDYAFALGALAHYVGDNDGHRIAVNRSVPLLYPKLRRKFGDVVVYDEDPAAHLKTEFGYDVLQVAKGHYAPDNFRDYIGFQVANDLLARAFKDTYCLDLKSIFTNYDLAIGTFRRSVSNVIPEMTKVAWQEKKSEIQKDQPGITERKFIFNLSRASYRKRWSEKYRSPGIGTRILAFLIRLIPKVGPFRALSFRTPTPEAEQLFMVSFNATIYDYRQIAKEQRDLGHLTIPNDNFDTGGVTGPGQYPLADSTHAELVDRLDKDHFKTISSQLRAVLLAYYSNLNLPFHTKHNKKEWKRVVGEIAELKQITPAAPAAGSN